MNLPPPAELSRPLGLGLSAKIIGALLAVLLMALSAIGATLWLSWQLQGGAAAINDAGSLRMRVTRLSLDVQRFHDGELPRAMVETAITHYDRTLVLLKRGDSSRPLLVPRTAQIQLDFKHVADQWNERIRPQGLALLAAGSGASLQSIKQFQSMTSQYVDVINRFVADMEAYNARNTEYLRYCQLMLAALGVVGTVALIYLMMLLVLNPLDKLHQGIQQLAEGHFDVAVPVESDDEFGQVSQGFNLMAQRLAEARATLEERVRAKTASLRQKNQELALLYEIAAFLNQPQSLESLCQGFLSKVMAAYRADGGAVRLTDPEQGIVYVVADQGMPEALLKEEHCIRVGDCLCGEVAETPASRVETLGTGDDKGCSREGYRVISAFPITVQGRALGLFNLHYREAVIMTPQQTRLLEVLGQNLAVAIENQRLFAKERELAVLEERNLVAQGLHDSIAQGLSFLNLQAQMLRQALQLNDKDLLDDTVGLIETGIKESYDDVRELLNNFRSKLSESLMQAISTVLERFRRQTGIKVELRSEGLTVPLMPEQQLQILFILQEVLSNVRKHAQATQVVVRLKDDGSAFELDIKDNGVGFAMDAVAGKADTHFGLSIMKERAARAGVALRISSQPGHGTSVHLKLPRAQRKAA
ncbi:type IV pili methyl-accepting chemotaxis transducer N-terminal domain-containing protein [Pseudogulbenkiania sp. MAI-1]|uniref:type IV pili methyl-accepting chemotaxis transducer N-terminal domain-containing protein n=1 Tax=Pseudogulbenkiania sp. MAI-1 TaxID=990370 RepID=UPI00045E9C58|nr:type IV pili methyl-accepting chemotaxis transducer N-terminal domain-containing protein [Pseudogulbenkiania sp. MAI-1]